MRLPGTAVPRRRRGMLAFFRAFPVGSAGGGVARASWRRSRWRRRPSSRWAGDPLADWKRRFKAVTKHTRRKRDRRRAGTARRTDGAQAGASASPAENEPRSEAERTRDRAGDERTETAPKTQPSADAHDLPSVGLTTRFLSLCQRYGSEQLAVRIVAAGRSTGIAGLPPNNDWKTWNAHEMRAAVEHLQHKLGR